MWLTYYLLIGLGFTFIVETSSIHHAEEIQFLKGDDKPFESFSMMERLLIIVLWPMGIMSIVKELFKKDDEY